MLQRPLSAQDHAKLDKIRAILSVYNHHKVPFFGASKRQSIRGTGIWRSDPRYHQRTVDAGAAERETEGVPACRGEGPLRTAASAHFTPIGFHPPEPGGSGGLES